MAYKTIWENTQTKYNSKSKQCKTKLPWFSRLLQHSASKWDGHILQYSWAHIYNVHERWHSTQQCRYL